MGRRQQTKKTKGRHNLTQKMRVHGEILGVENGWIKVQVYGTPYQMGYANGRLLRKELAKCMDIMKYMVDLYYGVPYTVYKNKCKDVLGDIVRRDFPEIYEEMRGISDGASASTSVDVDDILAWNSYFSMTEIMENAAKRPPSPENAQRCSAFIATGSATKTGEIVMAHNTHCHYALGAVSNVILYASPQIGYSFMMQTCAGLVSSTMDWFICSSGIVGCETTIAGIQYTPEFGAPYFCRIRQCMQFGKSLDEYAEIMKTDNAGDYACSWLFGDVNTNEIMLCELGRKSVNVQKTHNGVYYGMNSPINYELRALETDILDTDGVADSTNARRERLEYLLLDKYVGRIDASNAKKVIADHYDAFLGKTQMSSRTICKHEENDKSADNSPVGAVDGKVLTSSLAKRMAFWGRFGSSCGRDFVAAEHIRHHGKNKNNKHLKDFPKRPWIILSP